MTFQKKLSKVDPKITPKTQNNTEKQALLEDSEKSNEFMPPVSFHDRAVNFKLEKRNSKRELDKGKAQGDQLLVWSKYSELLESQINEHEIQLATLELEKKLKEEYDLAQDKVSLMLEIDELKEELLKVSAQNANKEKAIETVDIANQYIKHLYGSPSNLENQDFLELANTLKELDSELMRHTDRIAIKEASYDDLESKVQAEATANQNRFKKLEVIKTKNKGEKFTNLIRESSTIDQNKELTNSIKQMKRKVITFHEVLTGLVLESHINWFEDKKFGDIKESLLEPENILNIDL